MLHRKTDIRFYYKYNLEIAIIIIVILLLIILKIIAGKLLRQRKTRRAPYNVLYDRKISESLIERNLPLPPFPTPLNA